MAGSESVGAVVATGDVREYSAVRGHSRTASGSTRAEGLSGTRFPPSRKLTGRIPNVVGDPTAHEHRARLGVTERGGYMNITALTLAVLRVQYSVVRYPLRLIDDQVIAHLAPAAPARRLYRGGLGLLDGVAGTVLGHRDRADHTAPGVADARTSDVAPAAVATTRRAAKVENTELNEKASKKLDTDSLAEHLKDVKPSNPRGDAASPDTADPATTKILTELADAASSEPDTTLTGELADRVAALSRAETPPPGVETNPAGEHH